MTDQKSQILIVEDEPDLASLLGQYLENAGFDVKIIADGLIADSWIRQNKPDLIVLDLMLPGKSGLDICKDLRTSDATPIIMTTAKVEEIDRLLGLELGADDYICKPYSPREVVARVKTVLRRFYQTETEKLESDSIVKIDHDRLIITINSRDIELTPIEMNLFCLLFESPGKIFSRQLILENIYSDYRIVSDRTVDSHIKKLRKKIHEILPEHDIIKSIYGVGYKYEPYPSSE